MEINQNIINMINENLKDIQNNVDKNYQIETDFNCFKQIIEHYNKEDRLCVAIMLYMYCPTLYVVKYWGRQTFIQYVYDTEEDEYIIEWEKIFKII